MAEFGYTKPGVTFPGFINVRADEDGFLITLRADPLVRDGFNVCGQTCLPGGPECNNYCNAAPQKGKMQDRPKPAVQTLMGDIATLRLTREQMLEWISGAAQVVG